MIDCIRQDIFLLCWSISIIRLGDHNYRIPARSWRVWRQLICRRNTLESPTSNVVFQRSDLDAKLVELFVHNLQLQLGRSFLGAPRRFHFFRSLLDCEWRERPARDTPVLIFLGCEPPRLTPKVFKVVVKKNLRSTTCTLPPATSSLY